MGSASTVSKPHAHNLYGLLQILSHLPRYEAHTTPGLHWTLLVNLHCFPYLRAWQLFLVFQDLSPRGIRSSVFIGNLWRFWASDKVWKDAMTIVFVIFTNHSVLSYIREINALQLRHFVVFWISHLGSRIEVDVLWFDSSSQVIFFPRVFS